MSDDGLMREVEDDLRRERMQRLWAQYRKPFLIVVALLLVMTAGNSIYSEYQHKQAGIAMQKLDAGIALMNQKKPADAATQFAALVNDATGERRDLALLWLGRAQAEAGQADDAMVTLNDLATKPSGRNLIWRDMACLRLLSMAANAPQACAEKSDSPLQSQRMEWQAANLWSAGKNEEARSILTALSTDENATQTQRERASRLLGAIPAAGAR